MAKTIKIILKDNFDDVRNTKFYNKGDCLKVEDNEYSDYYHLWSGNKLDLIPKKICNVLGVLKG